MRQRANLIVLCLAYHASAQDQFLRIDDRSAARKADHDRAIAMERALLDGRADSVRFWRDSRIILDRKGRSDTCALLSDRERTMLNYLIGDHQALLDDIARGHHYFKSRGARSQDNRGRISYYGNPDLEYGLYDLPRLRSSEVLAGIRGSLLEEEDKEFLSLYWMAMLNSNYYADSLFTQAELNRRSDSLLSHTPDHRFRPIIERNIRVKYVPGRWGLGGGLFITYPMFLSQGLRDQFSGLLGLGISGEVVRGNWFYQAEAFSMDSRLTRDLQIDTSMYLKDDQLDGSFAGFSIGRVFLDDKTWRLSATIGAYGCRLTYQEGETPSYNLPLYYQPMAQLVSDFKFQHRTGDPSRPEVSYTSIRLRAALAPLGYGPDIGPDGPFVLLSLGYYGYYKGFRRE